MPRLNPPSPYAYYTVGESLCEPEHAPYCDANNVIRQAANGQPVMGRPGREGIFWPEGGYDDLQQDIISVKEAKERIEAELGETFEKNEFTEAELKHIPASVKKRFKIKTKSEAPLVPPAEPKAVTPPSSSNPAQ